MNGELVALRNGVDEAIDGVVFDGESPVEKTREVMNVDGTDEDRFEGAEWFKEVEFAVADDLKLLIVTSAELIEDIAEVSVVWTIALDAFEDIDVLLADATGVSRTLELMVPNDGGPNVSHVNIGPAKVESGCPVEEAMPEVAFGVKVDVTIAVELA